MTTVLNPSVVNKRVVFDELMKFIQTKIEKDPLFSWIFRTPNEIFPLQIDRLSLTHSLDVFPQAVRLVPLLLQAAAPQNSTRFEGLLNPSYTLPLMNLRKEVRDLLNSQRTKFPLAYFFTWNITPCDPYHGFDEWTRVLSEAVNECDLNSEQLFQILHGERWREVVLAIWPEAHFLSDEDLNSELWKRVLFSPDVDILTRFEAAVPAKLTPSFFRVKALIDEHFDLLRPGQQLGGKKAKVHFKPCNNPTRSLIGELQQRRFEMVSVDTFMHGRPKLIGRKYCAHCLNRKLGRLDAKLTSNCKGCIALGRDSTIDVPTPSALLSPRNVPSPVGKSELVQSPVDDTLDPELGVTFGRLQDVLQEITSDQDTSVRIGARNYDTFSGNSAAAAMHERFGDAD